MTNNELQQKLSLLLNTAREKMTDAQVREMSEYIVRNINYTNAKANLSMLKQIAYQLNIIESLTDTMEIKAKLRQMAAEIDKHVAIVNTKC